MPELRQLVRDAPTTPRRVLTGHAPDEFDELGSDRWSPKRSGLPCPEASEAATVPINYRRRLHYCERIGPSRPRPREQDPKRSVERAKSGARLPTPEHCDLLPKSQALRD